MWICTNVTAQSLDWRFILAVLAQAHMIPTRTDSHNKTMCSQLRTLCLLITVCFQLAACSRHPMSIDPNAPILKIAIMADGRIMVDGSPATIDSLRSSLKRLAEQKGVVWYYREGGQSAPPPQSAEVMKAVIENRLPIKLSSRPDYSDAIGMDGRPIANAPAGK